MSVTKCRIFQTSVIDPYRNLAAEELLLGAVQPDEIILYLWQNDNTIVIGRNQDAYQECNVDLFRADGGHLSRRLSGGGAVYHDMGNLNFTFIVKSPDYDLTKQTAVIKAAVRHFGIDAEFTGRNDLTANGKKFSGNAFYSNGKQRYHHGTILIAGDTSKMMKYLTPSKEKLASKGVRSVESRVINLHELSDSVTLKTMRAALTEAIAEVYDVTPQEGSWADIPEKIWDEKTRYYGSDEWLIGKRSRFDKEFSMRVSEGMVTLRLTIQDGVIESAKVITDCMDPDWAESETQKLTGCRFRRADLLSAGISEEIVNHMADRPE